jgi:hypothetical protein
MLNDHQSPVAAHPQTLSPVLQNQVVVEILVAGPHQVDHPSPQMAAAALLASLRAVQTLHRQTHHLVAAVLQYPLPVLPAQSAILVLQVSKCLRQPVDSLRQDHQVRMYRDVRTGRREADPRRCRRRYWCHAG